MSQCFGLQLVSTNQLLFCARTSTLMSIESPSALFARARSRNGFVAAFVTAKSKRISPFWTEGFTRTSVIREPGAVATRNTSPHVPRRATEQIGRAHV